MNTAAPAADGAPFAWAAAAAPLKPIWAALAGAALYALALWAGVQLLPVLPWPLLALCWLALAAPPALATGWLAAVYKGHAARRFGAPVRRVLYRGGLRVALAGLAGLTISALMVLRLAEAGPALWLAAALALFLPVALLPRLVRGFDGLGAGLHALWAALRLAVILSALAALGLHLGLAWLMAAAPDAQPAPDTASALAGEALTLARLWAGFEAFMLGLAAGFGEWGRLLATALVSAGLLAGFAALALAGVAMALSSDELGRALAPASDALPAPAPGGAGKLAAALLAVALIAGTGLTERRLAAEPPEARPAAQIQTGAEKIGDAFYRAGTHEALMALRSRALAEDAAQAQALAAALEAGFDAMEANVDPFLDAYYSLSAEYLRLFHWATGRLEGHLQARLETGLGQGGPFAGFEASLQAVREDIAARHAALAEQEAGLLAANRIDEANPARLRLDASFPALPAFEGRFARDLEAAQLRWGAAAGAGLASAAIAGRVVRRLAARGVLRTAAVTLSRAAGLLVAFGVDYALLRIDEARNRDDFRAEIMAEIDALRVEALSSLPPAEG